MEGAIIVTFRFADVFGARSRVLADGIATKLCEEEVTEKVTVPLKFLMLVTVTVEFAEEPAVTVTLSGNTLTRKSGMLCGSTLMKITIVWTIDPLVPVTFAW